MKRPLLARLVKGLNRVFTGIATRHDGVVFVDTDHRRKVKSPFVAKSSAPPVRGLNWYQQSSTHSSCRDEALPECFDDIRAEPCP